jgi:hypothetical protein
MEKGVFYTPCGVGGYGECIWCPRDPGHPTLSSALGPVVTEGDNGKADWERRIDAMTSGGGG